MILAFAIVCALAAIICGGVYLSRRIDAALKTIDLTDDGYGASAEDGRE